MLHPPHSSDDALPPSSAQSGTAPFRSPTRNDATTRRDDSLAAGDGVGTRYDAGVKGNRRVLNSGDAIDVVGKRDENDCWSASECWNDTRTLLQRFAGLGASDSGLFVEFWD